MSTDPITSAGTAPIDATAIAPDVTKAAMDEGAAAAAAAAGEEGADEQAPVGGEATVAATSWSGEAPGELEHPPEK